MSSGEKDLTMLTDLEPMDLTPNPPAADSPILETTIPETVFEPLNEEPITASTITEPFIEPQKQATQFSNDLAEVKEFAEKIQVIETTVEIDRPFFLHAEGSFDEKTQEVIKNIVADASIGIRKEDIALQLQTGKLFIPRISRYAAVYLAIKIREYVTDLRIQPSEE